VYVEETSFRSKSIEGVSTSTTGFVGPARKGPIGGAPGEMPELLTSFADFERIYGGLDPLRFNGAADSINYLAHAVNAYFNEGGSRLYVSRTYQSVNANNPDDGRAFVDVEAGAQADENIRFIARFPGAGGNGRIIIRETTVPATTRSVETAREGTLLRVEGNPDVYRIKRGNNWFDDANAQQNPPATVPDGFGELVGLTVITEEGPDRIQTVYEDLGFSANHPRYLGTILSETPSRRTEAVARLFAARIGAQVSAFELRQRLAAITAAITLPDGTTARVLELNNGNDGAAPSAGAAATRGSYAACLSELGGVEDISIIAAPGYSAHPTAVERGAIQNALIAAADRRRAYRIAVLDSHEGQGITEVRGQRSQIDSTRAALYFPWVVSANPLARAGRDDIPREIRLPPSGFVCGIYARNDSERGVFKAPANEVVRGALRFDFDVNFGQQEVLNPLGVNCLRFFAGRGYRVWGARTVSSDPEWKYVNIRRYFNYLEASIDRGTQWAVFEPNGERLWANIRQTVSDFLYNEWVSGALLGATPQEAFFVRCDRSTMTQNDLDNGRLICLVGVAAIKPAEFVIFRIGQKTADARA
jgi:phage tail sheath protein FI